MNRRGAHMTETNARDTHTHTNIIEKRKQEKEEENNLPTEKDTVVDCAYWLIGFCVLFTFGCYI